MKIKLIDKIHRIVTQPANIISGAILLFLLMKFNA